MTVRKTVICLLLAGLLSGCAEPRAPREKLPPPVSPPAEAPVPDKPVSPAPKPKAKLPPQGVWVERSQLPDGLRLVSTSPDGQWEARAEHESYSIRALWIVAKSGDRGLLAAPSVWVTDRAPALWTYRGTLLVYQDYGLEGGQRDTWWEADPAAGTVTPLAPALLSGRNAGNLKLSPDGNRLLAETNICLGCNKPSENTRTTYLIDLTNGTWQEVGVDVDARWENGQVVTLARAPRLGYSGMPTYMDRDESGALLISRPFAESFQVGAAESAHWRVYSPEAGPDALPLRILPALNRQDTYNSMDLWWPDPPAEPVRLELWAEIRPGVPADPAQWPGESKHVSRQLRHDGGKRWAVLWSEVVSVKEDLPPRQTVRLSSARMWDGQNGWGTDWRGRILRTEDGGATWRDVSPSGLERCDGRLFPQQVEAFAALRAAVAITCYTTGPDGHWAKESGQVMLLQTSDGGQSWHSAVIDSGFAFASPQDLFLLDDRHAWFLVRPKWPELNEDGALFRTADGGRTWEQVSDTRSGLPAVRETSFLTADLGWTVRGARLHRTEDGGRTWAEQPLPSGRSREQPAWASAPRFIDSLHGFLTVSGWVEGHRPGLVELFATTDGGQTWEKRSERDGERRPAFLTPDLGYVWEYEIRTVYWTRDGGRTWESRRWEINPTGITDVHFVDGQRGFGVQGHLWTTADEGQTWHEIYPQAAP